jgi:hypothetical protein
MVQQLKKALVRWKNDSPVGKLIVAGFTRAALESKILPNAGELPRSREGIANIVEVAMASIRQAPEAAADLADALAKGGRLDVLDTTNLMKLVRNKDGDLDDRFIGLYPALETLPTEQKKRLTDILFDVYRPELIRRHDAAKDDEDGKLIDMIIDLTRLKKPVTGWQAIGAPPPTERIWRYYSFDPLTEKDKRDPRLGERFRDVALPPGLEKWYSPEFDDSKWQSGRAPVGVGVFKAHGHGRMWTATPDHSFKNNSEWGNAEFLLMRTAFDVADLDNDYYRISILADQGYHIYLNGQKIHTYVWFSHFPRYHQIMLTGKETRHLKKGANTLAVYTNARHEKDPQTEKNHLVGQIDLFLEGLKKKEIGIAR